MARRKIKFIAGEYYHIYNRGCNRDRIFREEENYRYLLSITEEKVTSFHAAVIAYCLMPNHYHFLLRQDSDASVGKCIQEIFNRYAKAFNALYNRTGTLFEGPFKAVHVGEETYLTHLCRYIHRNPLDAALVSRIEDWKYSNYLEWIGLRKGSLMDKAFIQDHFGDAREYKRFVMEYESPKHKKKIERYLFD